MLTDILLCIAIVFAIAFAIWSTTLFICKMVRGQFIHWCIFMFIAISWTFVITHFIGIW